MSYHHTAFTLEPDGEIILGLYGPSTTDIGDYPVPAKAQMGLARNVTMFVVDIDACDRLIAALTEARSFLAEYEAEQIAV